MRSSEHEGGTAALKKGLSVLTCFSWYAPALSVSEIAAKLSLPLSTASRIVSALVETGFLDRDEDSRQLRLGSVCYYLGSLAKRSGALRTVALPYMEELRRRINETVNLYLREGRIRVCYEQLESSHNLKRSAKLGDRFPLWAGASGRCFLAFMKPEDVASILKDATPLTPNTLVDPAKVEERLRVVRTRGYEMSSAEREQGVSSVAVPIFDASNMPVACLTVSGPIPRFTESMVAELVPAAIESARAISLRLGAELGDGTTLPRPQDD